MASPSDLVSLADLKAWLDIAGTEDDLLLGQLITQISRAILNVLDRPSILPGSYTEMLDGGNDIILTLRQWPVNAISACSVNGVPIPPSPSIVSGAGPQTGYVLEPPGVAPPGVMQRLSLRRMRFLRGVQNVSISYSAGYQINCEMASVPNVAPYNAIVSAPYGDWGSDGGVKYVGGVELTPVAAAPAPGQYVVANGVYTFASSDAGTNVEITYGYIPADLAACCIDWAGERYAYRSRIGQRSKSLGGQETMTFIVKDIPDFVASALQPYRRVVTP